MRSISWRNPAVARRASASIDGASLSTKRPGASNCCMVIVNVRAGLRTHIKVVGLCSSVKATKRDIELYFFINAPGKVDFGQDWERFARLGFYLQFAGSGDAPDRSEFDMTSNAQPRDMRTWIADLEAANELIRIDKPVDPLTEMGSLLYQSREKALFFENLPHGWR